MPKSVEAIVTPDVLVWARETAGVEPHVLAHKLKITPEELAGWEGGQSRPSFAQLKRLSEILKRHPSVFYLAERPKGGFQPPKDYRRLHGATEFLNTAQLNYEIRLSEDRREVALNLAEDLEETPIEFTARAAVQEKPDQVAARIRTLLGVDYAQQFSWPDPNEALNRWRAAIERAGVLVFQASTLDPNEVRGFSISEFPFPVITLNRKDFPAPRIFTLIHELAHIMLHKGGICDIHEEYRRSPDAQEIEVFCNHVAGATLVGGDALTTEYEELKKTGEHRELDEYLAALSGRFKVSREVILRRFLTIGWVSENTYKKKREEFLKEYAELRKKRKAEKKAVVISPPRNVLSSVGVPFVQLVLNGYQQERITASDLADYLSMKTRHLPKLQAELESKAVRYWASS